MAMVKMPGSDKLTADIIKAMLDDFENAIYAVCRDTDRRGEPTKATLKWYQNSRKKLEDYMAG